MAATPPPQDDVPIDAPCDDITDEYLEQFPDYEDYKARLRELEAQMKEVEEREKEMAEKIRAECKAEMDERMARLEAQVSNNLTDRMHNLEERYRSHTSDLISNKQTEVLRANKVLREVARGLGADWRFVFKYLMAGRPKEVIDIEMEKLERVKPFMQPYKALLTWKEYKADEFDIRQLITALENNLKTELAYMARDIMQSEGESLLTLTNIGKGIASGAEEDLTPADTDGGAAGEVAEGAEGDGSPMTVNERKKLSMNDGDTVEGPIGDTKLLNLARKLGAEWPSIAKMLQLEEEEVDELREISDSTMAAFRMLWSWRDQNSSKREEDLVNELIVVLRRSGRTELSQIFIKESSA